MSIEVTNADVSWGNTKTVESTCDEVLQNIDEIKKYLLGRVLTIVDATYADREQRKALKDLVKHAFYEKEYHSDTIVQVIYQFAGKDGADKWLEKVHNENITPLTE